MTLFNIGRAMSLAGLLITALLLSPKIGFAAPTSQMYLSPVSQSGTSGRYMIFDVMIDTGGSSVNTVQSVLTYSSTNFSYVSITPDPAFNAFPAPTVAAGSVQFTAGTTNPVNGIQKVATVTLVAAATGSSPISLAAICAPSDFSSTCSAAYDAVDSSNTLAGITGATYTVTPASDRLTAGQMLSRGESITSASGVYRLVMQSDGNLVIYNSSNQPLWHTGTGGSSASRVVMQSDGNLVLYNTSNKPLWYNSTNGYTGSTLVLQNDSNLVSYNSLNRAVWSRMTGPLFSALNSGQILNSSDFLKSSNGQYRGVLQTDGNLVIYNASNQALWYTGTNSPTANRLVLQTDGNLVIYNASNQALWSWRTGKL